MTDHVCVRCKTPYPCPWCHTPTSYICPTLNEDEDGNLCDPCLETIAKEMYEYAEKHGL